jgi:predicted metal-binding protein
MKNKVVPFKAPEDLPFSMLQRLTEAGKKYDLESIYPFSVKEIIVAEWVSLKCRYGCSRYNRSWCCPPATPGPDKVRQILSEYSQALLLQSSHYLPQFYRDDDSRKRSTLVRCWKGTVSLERFLFLSGYHKAFSLVGESCALCKKCVYPSNCRFPQEKRPSLESFSIDVVGTLQRLGIRSELANDINEPFTYYAMILVS